LDCKAQSSSPLDGIQNEGEQPSISSEEMDQMFDFLSSQNFEELLSFTQTQESLFDSSSNNLPSLPPFPQF